MKKKHIYVLIVFVILTVLIAGIWKGIEQANLNKYKLSEQKIEKYQNEIKSLLDSPSDELIKEMTESYETVAQKEYDKRVSEQIPITQVILISLAISALSCAVIEFVLYIIQKNDKK